MDELVAVVEQFAIEILLHERQYVLEELVERDLVGTDGSNGELGPREQVLGAYFRRGNFELVSEPRLQAPDDHSLLLEAPAPRQVKVEQGVGDNHGNWKSKIGNRSRESVRFDYRFPIPVLVMLP